MNSTDDYAFIPARGNGKIVLSMAYFISKVYGISLEEAYHLVFECFYGEEGE